MTDVAKTIGLTKITLSAKNGALIVAPHIEIYGVVRDLVNHTIPYLMQTYDLFFSYAYQRLWNTTTSSSDFLSANRNDYCVMFE